MANAPDLKGLDKAVRKALSDDNVQEGETRKIVEIYVTNVSNNPIHEYRIVLGPRS